MKWFGLFSLSLVVAGCARGPNVGSGELPLRRVVVYRNGVGYFERSGHVDDERVTFAMRQRMVGDFLASLAVIERGGSSVRSASFPLEVEEREQPAPDQPIPSSGAEPLVPPKAPAPRKKPDPEAMRDVVLHLDGKEHDLAVGYLSETPVWRPSYRVVVAADGKADLQAWGIVQNLSGEDWVDVSLSLVAGAPLAFQSTLGTPVIPQRPIVTDEGEVVLVVPTGVTSLDQSGRDLAAPEPAPSAAPAMEQAVSDGARADRDEALEESASGAGNAPQQKRMSKQAIGAKPAAVAPPPPPMAPKPVRLAPTVSAPRRLSDSRGRRARSRHHALRHSLSGQRSERQRDHGVADEPARAR